MLIWLLLGIGTAVFFAIIVLRDAMADDKRRKTPRARPAAPGKWK
jgi:hypothetical protein